MEAKKAEHIETVDWWLPGPVGGENGEMPLHLEIPIWEFSSPKSTNFQLENELVLRLNVQHGYYSYQYFITHMWMSLRVEKKRIMWDDGDVN